MTDEAFVGLEGDEEGARVVREELSLLRTVQAALDSARAAELSAASGRLLDDQRLLELRDDVATAKPEDLPALFEQMHTLSAVRAQRGRGVVGGIDRSAPYFAHLRLEESGRRRDVLIGARSYVDPEAGIRIVDWRNAPVSRIYYRYAQGDEYEEPLGGRVVEGTVLARRSVSTRGGVLVRVAAPEGTFVRTETGWRRVATEASRLQTERKWHPLGAGVDGELRVDKHLPAIAALLDKEQFALITRPGAGLVVVQGSAGSGKTTVGLHRVAYLANADPQRYRPDRMLVVVPNEALIHYVDRVLPSLGVHGVPVVTFSAYAAKVLTALLPKLPTDVTEETPPVVSRAKSHAAVLRAVDRAAARLQEALDARLRKAMGAWPEGSRAVTAWEATGASAAVPPPVGVRVSMLAQWLNGHRKLSGAEGPSALPEVTRAALSALLPEVSRQAHAVVATWDELFTVRERLDETFRGTEIGPGQLDQVHDWCVRRARLRSEGERDGELPAIDAEDVALLLRIWQRLRGPLHEEGGRPIRFNHVFVDEVQDASPVELRVLLDLAADDRSVTLAGDAAQRMFSGGEDRGELDWDRLLADLDVPHTRLEPLRVSYRSTAEISAFARGVLGALAQRGGDFTEPIATRHGPPVELFTFASPGEAVAFLADALRQLAHDEPDANVALISRFPQHADLYFEGLERAEVARVRRIARQDFTWEPGFDVTDVRQTKGLEFDEVILLETTAASYPDNPAARHALYVASTRAAHQLWCVASDKASPVVENALRASLT